ncbi:S-adenosylmethionine decarboxylase [Candidatus Micrarchaeota archaeon]|nr:S-adenosylmethionine decarboxylase [Candidatus Micrarchaeota archaeon]
MSKLEHIHMTVNAKIDPTFKALPKAEASRFVDKLLKEIGMKPLGPINWADAEDLDFPGQSFVQMITTSHCSLHLFTHADGTNEIYFDLYSCKCYNTERVIELLDKKFGLLEWHGMLYTRAADKDPQIKVIGNDAIARKQQEVLVETN